MIHELKTDVEVFQQLWDGRKTAEVRKFDRDFKIADFLKLREYHRELDRYGSRHIMAWISDVTPLDEYGCPGMCLISFNPLTKRDSRGPRQMSEPINWTPELWMNYRSNAELIMDRQRLEIKTLKAKQDEMDQSLTKLCNMIGSLQSHLDRLEAS